MSSQSSEGNSSVRVSFVWGTDINTAAVDPQAKIEDEINELPDDIVRPRINKFDIADYPAFSGRRQPAGTQGDHSER